MSILRRKFLQMLGLGATGTAIHLPAPASPSRVFQVPPNCLYFGQELELAKEAYAILWPIIQREGKPYYIRVSRANYSLDGDSRERATIHAVWVYEAHTAEGNLYQCGVRLSHDIDFGRLIGPTRNYHFRMMTRVADMISEVIGCDFV